ncbi:hypothetical protein I7I53_05017 [Histoplasma capsulatum var. duboisii H88]|uniref:Uncharacterized protein n=1 Tax=Ajellomyces capsulatus (strain H88) TaxID=544711 RepID=A0A8A1LW05_AJEC8|nr:hypothetical protein I7I53_05017 [Histoplasma capsulatum var. duboisii H88]
MNGHVDICWPCVNVQPKYTTTVIQTMTSAACWPSVRFGHCSHVHTSAIHMGGSITIKLRGS